MLLVAPLAAVAVLGSAGLLSPGPLDPGFVTRVGLPLARGLSDITAAGTVGLLFVAAFLLPPSSGGRPGLVGGARQDAARVAARFAAVWAGCQALLVLLTYSNLTGRPVTSAIPDLETLTAGLPVVWPLTAGVALACATSLLAAMARTMSMVGWAALTAAAAGLPVASAGHAVTSPNHALAVDARVVHVLAVSVWVGGLLAILLLRRRIGASLPVVVGRYSLVAGAAFVLVAASGVAAAAARLDDPALITSTWYGRTLLAKAALFLTLGVAGWVHRRWLLKTAAGGGGGRWFVRLAAGELVLMAATVGLASALSVIPTPDTGAAGQRSPAEQLLGFPMPPPLTSGLHWLTQWRIDSFWLPVAVVAVAGYLVGVSRLRRRGDRWPAGRTVAWIVGWLLMTVATSGSPAVYGRVLFSAHMVEHMTIAMAVPLFLVFGAPVTLALRALKPRRDGSRGPREWLLVLTHSRVLRLLGHPLVAAGLFIASLAGFYYTSLFEWALSSHLGHVAMTVHFLAAGYLLASVIVGVDPGPARPAYPFRMILLMATFGFHALFAVTVMGSGIIFGGSWFAALGRPWGNTLAEEQYLGGALGWALGDYPIAIMAAAMAVAWIRSDEREAKRYDRQADRDQDADLASYNEQLRRMASQHNRRGL